MALLELDCVRPGDLYEKTYKSSQIFYLILSVHPHVSRKTMDAITLVVTSKSAEIHTYSALRSAWFEPNLLSGGAQP